MSGEGGGFLSRWSRRKRAAAAAAAAPPAAPPAAPDPPEAAPPEAPAAPSVAPPAFDPASLPPVESLTHESDFAAFLREEVPAALRRAALRRAWTLDPAIRDFVGPADYAWDYNAPDGVPGFSLEVPKNLERLIAQAIGAPPPAEEPRGEEGAPPPAEAAEPPPAPEALESSTAPEAPAAEEAPLEAPRLAEAVATPDGPATLEPRPREAPAAGAWMEEGPAPEALPFRAAASPVADAPPAIRRRHGGALPS